MPQAAAVTIDELFDFALSRSNSRSVVPAVPWICENFIDPVTKRIIQLESYQKRILRRALEIKPDGASRYDLVVWSQPKKSGKTAIASAVGAWVGNNVECPNEITCIANDQEQAAGRIFSAMVPTLERCGWHIPSTPRGNYAYSDITGSIVKAIPCNYKGEAGANQGISLWSELWAYSGERLRRLWEEMTPPPTRKFRMRWVETYAGYKNESALLWDLYTRIFKDEREKELQPGVRKLWDDLPVYEVEEDKMLVFWDHVGRMPWQTDEYYRSQRVQLRPAAYSRLHGNYWSDSAESFITEDMWRNSLRGEWKPMRAIYALDGSKNCDCTALVGCVRRGDIVVVTDVHVWEPKDGKEIDQSEVMKVIQDLKARNLIREPLYYDPYQLVKMAQDLRRSGVRCEEFRQMGDRIKSDTTLFKLFQEGKIITYPHPLLRQHLLSASVKRHGDDEVRIVKAETDNVEDDSMRKVDAAVALAMSAYHALKTSSGGWSIIGGGKSEPATS